MGDRVLREGVVVLVIGKFLPYIHPAGQHGVISSPAQDRGGSAEGNIP